jgi:hypothetical protein
MHNNLTRNFLLAIVMVVAGALSMPLAAQPRTFTVDEIVDSLRAMGRDKCQGRGQAAAGFEREGKFAEARSVRIGEAMVCDCMPAQLQALREQMTPKERSQRLSPEDFMKNHGPRYLHACAAAALRQTYGEGCAQTLGAQKANGAKFCACMSSEVARLTDAEAARLGEESADYTTAAAQAKARGQAAPARPPLIARLTAANESCSKP